MISQAARAAGLALLAALAALLTTFTRAEPGEADSLAAPSDLALAHSSETDATHEPRTFASRGPTPAGAPRIALIIDDIGYRPVEGQRAVRLPGPVAVAVLPHTPHAASLASEADARGKEIVLHVPMQALEATIALGPGALDLDQTRDELAGVLAAGLASLPHVTAVSNHMGSWLTREAEPMRWIMEELRSRGSLFFVDSYTTAESVALEAARDAGVQALRRDVFLDGDPSPAAVEREWRRLIARARERGFAVGIGHPHPATLDFLERELPGLDASGIRLVPLAALLGSEVGHNSRP